MEVLTRHFVAVETADFYQDKFGRVFVTVEFCRRTVMEIEPETLEEKPADGLASGSESTAELAGRMPSGLEWKFDDEKNTATYGGVEIIFRGSLQYQLLKMAQSTPVCNVRDVWSGIWGDGWPEWRTIRACANQVNLKLATHKVPYTLIVKSDFMRFLENF